MFKKLFRIFLSEILHDISHPNKEYAESGDIGKIHFGIKNT